MIQIDVRPVEAEHLALAHAGMQQQAQRRESEGALGLPGDQFDQRGVEPLELGGLEEVLHPPRRTWRERDLVRVGKAARCREAEQDF